MAVVNFSCSLVLLLAVFYFLQCVDSTAVGQTRGFLLTVPKFIQQNSNETVCLSLYGVSSDGHVNITLKSNKKFVAKTTHHVVEGKSSCLYIAVPRTTVESAEFSINGGFDDEDGYNISGKTSVNIGKESSITLIQTDKPIYKPGQKVKFRILRLDLNLYPISIPVEKVWIEDPAGIRIAMWSNIANDNGLADFSLQLSDEPPLGNWSIIVQQGVSKEIKNFIVKEYVLPKFSVEIISSPVMYQKQSKFSWKICSKYSYGQPVDGKVVARVKTDLREMRNASVVSTGNGCYDIEINASKGASDVGHKYAFQRDKWVTLYAEVTENGTGVKINASRRLQIKNHPFQVALDNQPYFKPGLNCYGKAIVTYTDGKPAPNITLNVFIETFGKNGSTAYSGSNNYTSNLNGEVDFIVAPQADTIVKFIIKVGILIKASYHYGHKTDEFVEQHFPPVYRWYSSSNSYIQVEPLGVQPSCGVQLPLTLSSVFAMDLIRKTVQIQIQVVARGNFVHRNKVDYFVKDVTVNDDDQENESENFLASPYDLRRRRDVRTEHVLLPVPVRIPLMLNVTPDMAPYFNLLLFYVRPDGEVVSDYRQVKIGNCLNNKVEMNFVEREILPGSMATVRLSAASESLCALSVVDESVYYLSNNNQLNAEMVFSKILALGQVKNRQQYEWDFNHVSCVVPKNGENGFLYDFQRGSSSYKDSMESFLDAGVSVISDLKLVNRPCRQMRPIWYRGPVTNFYSEPAIMERSHVTFDAATHFMSSVGIARGATSERPRKNNIVKPAVEIRDFFPETWLWELQKLGKDGKMTIEREIPHSITTWTGSALCTSSESGLGISDSVSIRSFQPFFLSVTMPYSIKNDELVPLKISIFSYLLECFPVKLSVDENVNFLIEGEKAHQTCVCGKQSHTHSFAIRAKVIGIVNVTVHAHTVDQNATVCKGIETADVTAHDAITKSLLVKAHGFPKVITNTTMICPSDYEYERYSNIYTLSLPNNVVEGSARAYVKIVGDVMGQTITGLDKLVRLPTGCGEQNMVKFVPNIHVLHYLTNTHQLTEDIEQSAREHLKTGYQRQLTYKHLDGSYSAFGKHDKEGSMWLTAFVLKSFAQAQPFTFIDMQELNSIMAYLKSHQMENGCFESTGRLLSKAMQGGLQSGQSSAVQALSAYVVVSLLEAGMNSLDAVIQNAMLCLEAESHPSVYLLALKTYAAVLAGTENLARKNWQELEVHSIKKDGMMYWKINDNSQQSTAADIEVTSYALLALLSLNETQHYVTGLSVIRWLVQQRNANGGFVSTQDTVLALQAMTKYAGNVLRKRDVDLVFKIETDELDDTIYINNDSRLVMHTRKVSNMPTVIDIEARGEGCALLEVTQAFNVHASKGVDALHLEVVTDAIQNKIHICTKYLSPDGKSNMAVVEINMLSGYEAISEKLEELKNDVQVQVKRVETADDGTVNLYFDELTSAMTCLDIYVTQTNAVQDVKPATIVVYDYYQPELSITKGYTFEPAVEAMSFGIQQTNCSTENCASTVNNTMLTKSEKKIRQKNRERFPVNIPDCPACLDRFPPNFPPILCYGNIAVIAEVRSVISHKLKLRRNVYSGERKFQRINRPAEYTINKSCPCSLLQKGQQVLIAGKLQPTNGSIPNSYAFDRDLYLIKINKANTKDLRKLYKQCKS